jgi:hypothetical protein
VTLEQLKTEIRNAYDARDREKLELALRALDALLRGVEPKEQKR